MRCVHTAVPARACNSAGGLCAHAYPRVHPRAHQEPCARTAPGASHRSGADLEPPDAKLPVAARAMHTTAATPPTAAAAQTAFFAPERPAIFSSVSHEL
jgi:hypothetical protein